MSHDNWKTKGGQRWNPAERVRVARRFRHHVRTASNPRGRIHREGCFWHPDVEAEAHHIDYERPFVVVWAGMVCGCHRRVERGSLRIPARAVHDYTSLIEAPGVARPGGRREGPVESVACTCGPRRRRDVERGRHTSPSCPKYQEVVDAVPF